MILSAPSVDSAGSSVCSGWGLIVLDGGLIGLFIMGLTGGLSPASSSSDSSSFETGIWVIFLGLNGLLSVGSADLTAALVVRLPAAPPRLAGRPLIPGRAGSFASTAGSMFSLSGS